MQSMFKDQQGGQNRWSSNELREEVEQLRILETLLRPQLLF